MLRTEVSKEAKISDTMVLLRLFNYQGALTVRYHRQCSSYRRRLFAAYGWRKEPTEFIMICFHFCYFLYHNHDTWRGKKGVNNQKREMSACPPIPLKKPYFMPFSSQPKYLLRSPSKAFPCLVSSLQVPILTFKKGIHLEKVPALSQTIVTERLILW